MTDIQTTPRLSVVIPFYNEGENVDRLLEEVHQAMAGSLWPWELIVVDDGSRDDTLSRMEEIGRASCGERV